MGRVSRGSRRHPRAKPHQARTPTSETRPAADRHLPGASGETKGPVPQPACRAVDEEQDPPAQTPADGPTHRAGQPHPDGGRQGGADSTLPGSRPGLHLLRRTQRLRPPHRRSRQSQPGQRPGEAGP